MTREQSILNLDLLARTQQDFLVNPIDDSISVQRPISNLLKKFHIEDATVGPQQEAGRRTHNDSVMQIPTPSLESTVVTTVEASNDNEPEFSYLNISPTANIWEGAHFLKKWFEIEDENTKLYAEAGVDFNNIMYRNINVDPTKSGTGGFHARENQSKCFVFSNNPIKDPAALYLSPELGGPIHVDIPFPTTYLSAKHYIEVMRILFFGEIPLDTKEMTVGNSARASLTDIMKLPHAFLVEAIAERVETLKRESETVDNKWYLIEAGKGRFFYYVWLALWAKYTQNPKMMEVLVSTAPRMLLYLNDSSMYGVNSNMEGKNVIGCMLMILRGLVMSKIPEKYDVATVFTKFVMRGLVFVYMFSAGSLYISSAGRIKKITHIVEKSGQEIQAQRLEELRKKQVDEWLAKQVKEAEAKMQEEIKERNRQAEEKELKRLEKENAELARMKKKSEEEKQKIRQASAEDAQRKDFLRKEEDAKLIASASEIFKSQIPKFSNAFGTWTSTITVEQQEQLDLAKKRVRARSLSDENLSAKERQTFQEFLAAEGEAALTNPYFQYEAEARREAAKRKNEEKAKAEQAMAEKERTMKEQELIRREEEKKKELERNIQQEQISRRNTEIVRQTNATDKLLWADIEEINKRLVQIRAEYDANENAQQNLPEKSEQLQQLKQKNRELMKTSVDMEARESSIRDNIKTLTDQKNFLIANPNKPITGLDKSDYTMVVLPEETRVQEIADMVENTIKRYEDERAQINQKMRQLNREINDLDLARKQYKQNTSPWNVNFESVKAKKKEIEELKKTLNDLPQSQDIKKKGKKYLDNPQMPITIVQQ